VRYSRLYCREATLNIP